MMLDTYAWIEFFRGTEKGKKVGEILLENPCFTSSISLAEISEFIEREKSDRRAAMEVVRTHSSVIDHSQQDMELAGILKVEKRKTEAGFGTVDAIILATARQYGLKIVTGDRHFRNENALML